MPCMYCITCLRYFISVSVQSFTGSFIQKGACPGRRDQGGVARGGLTYQHTYSAFKNNSGSRRSSSNGIKMNYAGQLKDISLVVRPQKKNFFVCVFVFLLALGIFIKIKKYHKLVTTFGTLRHAVLLSIFITKSAINRMYII